MRFKEWLDLQETLALKGSYKGGIFQRLVAAKYMLAPVAEWEAIPAFEELARKIQRQSDFLASKYQMEPTDDDPYASMKQMTQGIRAQQTAGKKPVVKVYAEPPQMLGKKKAGHPVFSNEEIVTQRYVHDVIAHYFGQHPFSARGEYSAYNRHLKTLCNSDQVRSGKCLAAKAMFTEVVAQTSCYYVYGQYVDQKAIILHDFDHYLVGQLAPESPLNRYFVVESKQLMLRPNFNWEEFAANESELATELLRQNDFPSKARLEPIAPQEFGKQTLRNGILGTNKNTKD